MVRSPVPFRPDRRTFIISGGLLLTGAAPDIAQQIRARLDEAATLAPLPRLTPLRSIEFQTLPPALRLDVAAALRGAELEAASASAADPAELHTLQLRLQSGTDTTPAQAYALAIDRARLLTARADRLLRAEGLISGSVADRLRALARDPRHLYPDDDVGRDQAVADMNRWLAAARTRLPTMFGLIPAAVGQVTVRRMSSAEEAAGKSGYRLLPAFDGSRSGAYIVDLRDIARRPRWSLPSVVHHELLPGHMVQLPLQEHAEPHPLRLRAAAGFVEGWAIYAEQLAAENGAYAQDRLAEIGCLQWLLFRLGRAIVDIGVNTFGWSDDAARTFMADLQGDPMIFAPFDKDIARVRAEPGSYAGHVLNWLAFEQMRDAFVRRRGDMRRAHDRLLAHGAAPPILLAPMLR